MRGIVADQILTDFDAGMSHAAHFGMRINRVVGRMAARIRFVVANEERIMGSQGLQHRHSDPWVTVPQHTGVPGPRRAVKARRETVNTEKNRQPALVFACCDAFLDCPMIRRVQGIAACIPGRLGQPQVARDQDSIADRRNDRSVTGAAVKIDDQPRIIRKYGVRAKTRLQAASDARCADIPRDMVGQIVVGDTEISERGRKTVARMVTNEDDTAAVALN